MKMKYEDAVKRLREICEKLRDENTTLEETAELYKEGTALVKDCERLLEGFSAGIGGDKNES